ncbi:hypothetical protein DL93DRAFT_2030908, partial [Clavulina sp. PMI_390]
QSVDRCVDLDSELAALARRHGGTKFIRARADALGFAVAGEGKRERGDASWDDEDEDEDGNEVDGDLLPTMQVYRGGDLVFNWVRVDWEAGAAGVGDLLARHHIIPSASR